MGIPEDRLVETAKDYLLCSICTDVCWHPVFFVRVCQCTHCSSCMKTWFRQGVRNCPLCRKDLTGVGPLPNLLMKQLIDDLQVQCLFCSWRGRAEQMEAHDRECASSRSVKKVDESPAAARATRKKMQHQVDESPLGCSSSALPVAREEALQHDVAMQGQATMSLIQESQYVAQYDRANKKSNLKLMSTADDAAASREGKSQSSDLVRVGSSVKIQGLQSSLGLNGMHGTCKLWVSERNRWLVQLHDGKTKEIKPEHLLYLRDDEISNSLSTIDHQSSSAADPRPKSKIGAKSKSTLKSRQTCKTKAKSMTEFDMQQDQEQTSLFTTSLVAMRYALVSCFLFCRSLVCLALSTLRCTFKFMMEVFNAKGPNFRRMLRNAYVRDQDERECRDTRLTKRRAAQMVRWLSRLNDDHIARLDEEDWVESMFSPVDATYNQTW